METARDSQVHLLPSVTSSSGYSRSLSYRGSYADMTPKATIPNPTPIINHGCALSERSTFQAGNPSPNQGGEGTVVAVALRLNFDIPGAVYIRLVAGATRLETSVSRRSGAAGSKHQDWVIRATMPPRDQLEYNATSVPITVHVLVDQKLIDFASCGHFTYSEPAPYRSFPEQPHVKLEAEEALYPLTLTKYGNAHRTCINGPKPRSTRDEATRRATSDLPSTSAPIIRRQRRSYSCPQRLSAYGLIRVPRSVQQEGEPLSLEFMTQLEDMCNDWNSDELRADRRLVKFTIIREGSRIMVMADRLSQDDYDENDVVVSCIRYRERSSFHITSVDVLYLFENICGQQLSVKEKTRLRRNIQCFSPIRLAKTDDEHSAFYRTIMDLPAPKPRTIDKKLKVFRWSLLKDLMEKILSKYCLSEPGLIQNLSNLRESASAVLPATDSLSTDGSSEFGSPPPLDYPQEAPEDDARTPLVMFYPGYPTQSAPPSSISADYATFDNSASGCGSLEYAYDMHDNQTSICSTASEVEAVYMQYAHDLSSIQYSM